MMKTIWEFIIYIYIRKRFMIYLKLKIQQKKQAKDIDVNSLWLSDVYMHRWTVSPLVQINGLPLMRCQSIICTIKTDYQKDPTE